MIIDRSWCTGTISLTHCIPVPSRLYFDDPSPLKPLSGQHFAIKDVMDLKGTRTSNCCRAYTQLYPPTEETAPCVQQLLQLGAIAVRKTKTVQFASGAHPIDWMDTHCPFNCRGDGYQAPGMSSAGSAAAMTDYDWLDFVIGTESEDSSQISWN
jgi:Asp-tRNA(Asn)/Glu-tRNA(Gln) amidotransferase A subunit family amidase